MRKPELTHNEAGKHQSIGVTNPPQISVLMYHRIVEDRDISRRFWDCVHVDDFRRQLELLDRWGFTTITFQDYQLYLEKKILLPRRPVIISFDDGYLDTYKLAYPVMKKFGMTGVVFVLGDRKVKTNMWDQSPGVPVAPLMDDLEIMELSDAGFEIGSHTMNHPRLTTLPAEEAWEQISRSRIVLEILLNASVTTFCYPYGLVTPGVKNMVKNAGYMFGCAAYTGPSRTGSDPYEIRRTAILNTTGPVRFILRLWPIFNLYSWLRWRTREFVYGILRNQREAVPLKPAEER